MCDNGPLRVNLSRCPGGCVHFDRKLTTLCTCNYKDCQVFYFLCLSHYVQAELCWGYEKDCTNERRLFVPHCEGPAQPW